MLVCLVHAKSRRMFFLHLTKINLIPLNEYLHAGVYSTSAFFCSSLAPLWRVCAVAPFAECDDFPSNQTVFIIIFSGCFVKMEHTHICINKILWPKLRMQTQCSTLNAPRHILDTRVLLFCMYRCVVVHNSLTCRSVYVKRLQRKWSFYFNGIYNLYLYTCYTATRIVLSQRVFQLLLFRLCACACVFVSLLLTTHEFYVEILWCLVKRPRLF